MNANDKKRSSYSVLVEGQSWSFRLLVTLVYPVLGPLVWLAGLGPEAVALDAARVDRREAARGYYLARNGY